MSDYKSLEQKYKNEFPNGTPLVVACEKGRLEDVETFVNAGMDVNELGKDSIDNSRTPLMAAAVYERTTVVSYLLNRPEVDPAITDKD